MERDITFLVNGDTFDRCKIMESIRQKTKHETWHTEKSALNDKIFLNVNISEQYGVSTYLFS